MGQLTSENLNTIEEMNFLIGLNRAIINKICKKRTEFILGGTHDNLVKLIEVKMLILGKENKEFEKEINCIYKENGLNFNL